MSHTTSTNNLPDFDDDAWNAERDRLEAAVETAALELVRHTLCTGIHLPLRSGGIEVGTFGIHITGPIEFQTN